MTFRPVPLVGTIVLFGFLFVSCGNEPSIVEPGPVDGETPTSSIVEAQDDEPTELETNGESTPTPTIATSPEDQNVAAGEAGGGDGSEEDVFLVDEDSDNAGAYTELAASGLVLTLDEQACADASAGEAVAAGNDPLDAVIGAVQACASPAAIDDFSSELIVAGGAALPQTEAACVSSRLQSGDEYQPYWAALLEEEPFDFLLADLEVQNRYLELYSECVSVGRAVAGQAGVQLSAPSVGCIDDLYQDREFVRITIEADLSGSVDEQARVNDQLESCLTSDERSSLGLE